MGASPSQEDDCNDVAGTDDSDDDDDILKMPHTRYRVSESVFIGHFFPVHSQPTRKKVKGQSNVLDIYLIHGCQLNINFSILSFPSF